MKWRCEWCGKPHESNDPPCDACGHGSFERAVVPLAPESDETQYVWVCADCGTIHPKNSPPCGSCGAMKYERKPAEDAYDLSDLDTPSYFELAKPLLPFVAILLVLLALFAAGILPVPAPIAHLLHGGHPTVGNVPGQAGGGGGLNFSVAEAAFVGRLNDDRTENASAPLTVGKTLDDYAEYRTKVAVVDRYGDDSRSFERWRPNCDGSLSVVPPTRLTGRFGSSTALGHSLADSLWGTPAVRDRVSGASTVGVDFHRAPDGSIFVTVAFC